MLYSLKKETGRERPKDKSTNKKKTMKEYTPCYESTTPHLCHAPIIHNNNTVETEFLVQMKESKKFGSLRNDEILNLHLGSGVGP